MDLRFDGRSLTELGNEIASRLGNGVQFENMTLCVQAGDLGRPIPLLTDLRDDPVIILAFMVDSPDENHIYSLLAAAHVWNSVKHMMRIE